MNGKTARLWATGTALAAGIACQSAAPRPPRTAAKAPDAASGFVGRSVILRSLGDAKAINIKQTQIGAAAGRCDVAAQVRAAAFDRGTVRLTLETIGRPRTERRGVKQERCGDDQSQIALNVSGFAPDVSASELETALAPLLQTPEAYLRLRKIQFDPPGAAAAAVPEPVARFTTAPTRLLWADAIRRDPARRVRHEGEVEVEGVVGLDGRLHAAKVVTPLSREHEDSVLRVVPLWRFQPGRRGEEAVAVKVRERMVFRII
jgi:TonB family protein